MRKGSSSSSSSSEIEEAVATKNALFGKYEMGRLLGCGAFAKVYYGRDIRPGGGHGQSVAIKVINKKKLSNSSLISNIKREITIMSRLNHPGIVKLHEVLATKSKIYFVMDLVKGGELFAKVAKAGRFNEDLCRKYFQQLISALGYCHARGVFHRDLKPENLLVDENGNLKVSDFGLSAIREQQIRSDGLLHTLCGTPAYVAPEILTKKGYDGDKVDVWSCGVILFVLSAGYLPFSDPNLMAMYKKIYKGEYRCPKWMSSDLKRFISRLLDTNPDTRITLDQIREDPWFTLTSGEEDAAKVEEEENATILPCSSLNLNAFDLISFSSGLNLSGLFDGEEAGVSSEERLVSEESPAKLVEKVEQIAKAENFRVIMNKKKQIELEAPNGVVTMIVEVYGLTDRLVVVEARRTAGDSKCYKTMWNNKIKPLLLQNSDSH